MTRHRPHPTSQDSSRAWQRSPWLRRTHAACLLAALATTMVDRSAAQTLAWQQRISSVAPAGEQSAGMAAFEEGGSTSVYGCGWATGDIGGAQRADGGGRAFLIKSDAQGRWLWATQFAGNGRAVAIAVNAQGVWVAGVAASPMLGHPILGGGTDVFLARFDASSGALLAVEIFGTPQSEEVSDVAVDASGLTVVGQTNGDLTDDPAPAGASSPDGFVRRYEFDSGNALGLRHSWTWQINGASTDVAHAVASGSVGGVDQVYVAYEGYVVESGQTRVRAFVARLPVAAPGGGGPPAATVRQLPSISLGTIPWSIVADGPSVYVSGQALSSGFLMKIASDTLADVWTSGGPYRVFSSLNNANGRTLVQVLGGSVVVAGSRLVTGGSDVTVLRCDSATGTTLATRSMSDAATNYPYGMAATNAGIFVLGYGYGSFVGPVDPTPGQNSDVFALRFDPAWIANGTVLYEFGTMQERYDQAAAVDARGNAYVAGYTSGTLPGQTTSGSDDAYVAQVDSAGQVVQILQFGYSGQDSATAIAVDDSGIFVAGSAGEPLAGTQPIAELGTMPPSTRTCFLRRLSLAGQIVWTRSLGVAISVRSIALVGSEVYLFGDTPYTFPGQLRHAAGTGEEPYVMRLGTDGTFAWVRQMGTGEVMPINGGCADESGVYFVGNLWSTAWPGEVHSPYSNADGYLVKLARTDGSPLWYEQSAKPVVDYASAVAVHAGAVYVGGVGSAHEFDPSISSSAFMPFVRRYEAGSGALLWTRVVQCEPAAGIGVAAIEADADGVFLGGAIRGQFPGFTNAGVFDSYVCRLSATGLPSWLLQFGGTGSDTLTGLATSGTDIYAVGYVDNLGRGDAVVTKISLDQPPVANAGPDRSLHVGVPVILDGSASYDLNTPSAELVYAWTFVSRPFGSGATLLAADQPQAGFIPDLPGEYVIELSVYDGIGQHSSDLVVVSSMNLAPTAAVQARGLVYVGATTLLNGATSFDPDGDPLSWHWRLVSAPAGSTASLLGSSSSLASFTPDTTGQYVIGLTVSDAWATSAEVTHDLMVVTAGQYAVQQIDAVLQVVEGLAPSQWEGGVVRTQVLNLLANAAKHADSNAVNAARVELGLVMARTDGFPLRGALDTRKGDDLDLIVDEAAQRAVYAQLLDALQALGG